MPAIATSRIVWVAILASSVIVFLSGWLVRPVDLVPDPATLIVLAAAAIASPSAGLFVAVPAMYRNSLRTLKLQVREEPTGGEPDGGYRGVSLSRKVIDDPQAPARVLRLYNTSVILGLAFAEVPALLGLIARVLGASWEIVLAFTAVAWIGIATRYPTEKKAFAGVERTYGATLVVR